MEVAMRVGGSPTFLTVVAEALNKQRPLMFLVILAQGIGAEHVFLYWFVDVVHIKNLVQTSVECIAPTGGFSQRHNHLYFEAVNPKTKEFIECVVYGPASGRKQIVAMLERAYHFQEAPCPEGPDTAYDDEIPLSRLDYVIDWKTLFDNQPLSLYNLADYLFQQRPDNPISVNVQSNNVLRTRFIVFNSVQESVSTLVFTINCPCLDQVKSRFNLYNGCAFVEMIQEREHHWLTCHIVGVETHLRKRIADYNSNHSALHQLQLPCNIPLVNNMLESTKTTNTSCICM